MNRFRSDCRLIWVASEFGLTIVIIGKQTLSRYGTTRFRPLVPVTAERRRPQLLGNRAMNKVLLVLLAISASSGANAATTIGFGTPSGNLGNSHSYSAGSLTIAASGYDEHNAATALYGKNSGGDEVGLGLANDAAGQNEIYFGKGFVQLDVSALFGKVFNVSFFTNSTSDGEQWSVFGSNVAGSYSGLALLSGTNESSAILPNFGTYKYYDFASTSASGGKNYLLGGVALTPAVPEPATWAMMLLGFGGMGVSLRRRRRSATAMQIA